MDTTSIWESTSEESHFPSLTQDSDAEVVIIGGGITGITAAALLSQAGRRVVVLEARSVGFGTTGHSTGNLYATVDHQLYHIRDKWNQETATAVARSRNQAVDFIEQIVNTYNISCDFARRPQYIFPTDDSQVEQMEKEYEAVRDAGLDAAIVSEIPLPFSIDQAVKIEHQAQFHPATYVRELANHVASKGCQIYENSRVIEIDEDELTVHTDSAKIHASKIILATHTPVGIHPVQTLLGPYREYALAARLADDRYPEGIFWSLEQPSHSIRSYDAGGTKYLIVIGEEHKTGQHDSDEDYYQKVEQYAHSHFKLDSIAYRWSAQNYQPADLLPYIGQTLASEDIYMATGFGTDGLTYGTLAARILADDILGQGNPWAELYRTTRLTPVKSAKEFLKENLDVAQQYVKGVLTGVDVESLEEIEPGEGRVAVINGKRLAIYRDESNQLTVLSPVCTHMGCIVRWNQPQKSWDCPCHGSRFRYDGEVIEGPALKALEKEQIGE
jgi:glycine/D-amino acid oxidase-like deaminating enzyme/nitrite reductase/ring-hydroxylating ferredoxin subunit